MDGASPRRGGRRRPRWRPASAPRSSWPACPTGCACADPSRDTVLYPAVSYPTYAMGATLAGCRAVAVPVDDGFRLDCSAIDPADAARALCLWVNTPGNPAGGLDDLGGGGGLGPGPRRAGVQRRVLHRVHLGRAAPHHPRARRRRGWWPSTRCRSGRTWPGCGSGCYAGDPELVHLPVRGAQARRVHGGRAGAGGGGGGVGRRRPRRLASAGATGLGWSGCRRSWPPSASPPRCPQGAFYLWVPGSGRRRLGLRPPAGRRGRRAGQPGRVLRDRPAPATSAWPWCGPTSSSSWWPSASAWPDRRRALVAGPQ